MTKKLQLVQDIVTWLETLKFYGATKPAKNVEALKNSKPLLPLKPQVPFSFCEDPAAAPPPPAKTRDPTGLLDHPVAPPPQPLLLLLLLPVVEKRHPEVAKMEPPQNPPPVLSMVDPSEMRTMEEGVPLCAEAVELPPRPPSPTEMRYVPAGNKRSLA